MELRISLTSHFIETDGAELVFVPAVNHFICCRHVVEMSCLIRYNVTLRRFHETIFAVEMRELLYIPLCVCVCVCVCVSECVCVSVCVCE